MSPELRDFICQLLDKNVMKRLDIQGALQVRGLPAHTMQHANSVLHVGSARAPTQGLINGCDEGVLAMSTLNTLCTLSREFKLSDLSPHPHML